MTETGGDALDAAVWMVRPDAIGDPNLLAAYLNLLDDDETARYHRFLRPADAHLFLVSHAMLRCTLSKHFDIAPDQWKFKRTEAGKPVLQHAAIAESCAFSLTHCDGLAACLISRHGQAGIDAEPVNKQVDALGIAARFFAEAEQRALSQLSDPDALATAFTKLWTLKEAYWKARGLGLTGSLKGCAFQFDESGEVRVRFDLGVQDDPAQWHFFLSTPTARHHLAVAIKTRTIPTVGEQEFIPLVN